MVFVVMNFGVLGGGMCLKSIFWRFGIFLNIDLYLCVCFCVLSLSVVLYLVKTGMMTVCSFGSRIVILVSVVMINGFNIRYFFLFRIVIISFVILLCFILVNILFLMDGVCIIVFEYFSYIYIAIAYKRTGV